MWAFDLVPINLWSVNRHPQKKMSVSLLINCALSLCAFGITKRLIPSLADMFISANLFGNDLCKRDKPKMYVVYIVICWHAKIQSKVAIVLISQFVFVFFYFILFFFFRPEAMGVVTGCILLVALFLFIPVPFIFNDNQINEFPHNQVQTFLLPSNK